MSLSDWFEPDPDHGVDAWFELPHDSRAPGEARRLADDCSRAVDANVRHDLALLVSELVTNAVTHGRPAGALHLVVTDELVRVDLFDHGLPPRTTDEAPTPTTATGRGGRAIDDTMAAQSVVASESPSNGKRVSFELRLEPSPEP